MSAAVGYLLDTNILLELIRGNPLGERIDAEYGLRTNLNRSMISVVTVGEMYSLVRQFGWGREKIGRLESMLAELVWLDINNPQVLEAYGEIDHASQVQGRRMGKNDVWIAATARVTGATLLTTDPDFDHLHGACIDRIWINPDQKQAR
ncbi:MAG: type II toxin-antitoxin system VapC family toxin [Thermoguttaceae bacterium]|jgi:predicted nucleic acid-binding protein